MYCAPWLQGPAAYALPGSLCSARSVPWATASLHQVMHLRHACAGSFFTNFKMWIKDPTQAANILGTAAPLQSIFFLSYVELNVSLERAFAPGSA